MTRIPHQRTAFDSQRPVTLRRWDRLLIIPELTSFQDVGGDLGPPQVPAATSQAAAPDGHGVSPRHLDATLREEATVGSDLLSPDESSDAQEAGGLPRRVPEQTDRDDAREHHPASPAAAVTTDQSAGPARASLPFRTPQIPRFSSWGGAAGRRVVVLFVGAVGLIYGMTYFVSPETDSLTAASTGEAVSSPVPPEMDRLAEGPLRVNRGQAQESPGPGGASEEELFRPPSISTRPVQRSPLSAQPPAQRTARGERLPQTAPTAERVAEQTPLTPRTPLANYDTPPDRRGALPQRRVPENRSERPGRGTGESFASETRFPSESAEQASSAYPTTDPGSYRDPLYDVPRMADRQGDPERR